MPRARQLAARSALAVALAWMVWCAPDASAQRSTLRIAVGEVAANDGDRAAARRQIDVGLLLDRPLELLGERARRRAELVLRGSLVRMTRERVAGGLEVRCEISVIVTDGGGSIRAMLRGRGGARGGGDPAQLSTDALRAAVRGALRPLASQGARLASAG